MWEIGRVCRSQAVEARPRSWFTAVRPWDDNPGEDLRGRALFSADVGYVGGIPQPWVTAWKSNPSQKTVSHSVAKVDFRLTGGHCSWPHPTCQKQCFFVLQEVLRGGGYVTAFFTVTHSGVDRGEKRAKTRQQNSTLSVNSFPAFLWYKTAVAMRPSSHVRGGAVFSEEAGITRVKAKTDS